MKLPERLRPSDTPHTRDAKLNHLVDFCKSLVVKGGPGLTVTQSAGGTIISALRHETKRKAIAGEAEDCSGGDIQSLSIVLGTKDEDEWDRAEGKQLVMSVITDIGWDSGGGNIVGRIRTLHFDKCGKLVDVGPEGDWVVLVPTESCAS